MANDILTPTEVTREALAILHQKLNFIGSINRQYDSRFANEGAKIGDTLQIRLPNEYTVRTGATLSTQDTQETSVSLTVATQKGVDVNFSSKELTMDIQDFADRILEPAMAVLAANIEADVFNVYKDVYNLVGTAGTTPNSYRTLGLARKRLADSLAPTSMRSMQLGTDEQVELTDALKGLFQSSTEIDKQYKEGLMGKTAGFGMIYENTLRPVHTNGSMGGTPLIDTAAAASGDTTIHIDGVTAGNTWTKGTVFTIAGVYEVHPETKATTTRLQQFVVTADTTFTGGEADVPISPSLVSTGGRQNISALPADNAAVTVVGSAAGVYAQNLAYHKDAFVFASADLEDVSKYGAWGAREVYDGISMRIARQYDITNDKVPCRIDVLYGYLAARPQLASRIIGA